MRAYADSSFILRLVTKEADSGGAIAEYRRLGTPPVFFLPLHTLEVCNAILQRAFHERRSLASRERQHINRDRDAALSRLRHFIARRTFLEVTLHSDEAIERASQLSRAHTERLGARAIDLLHVANALILNSEVFLTTDIRQAQLAEAESLKVITASPLD